MLLYIHIPYCDSKCYYCSFNSYVDKFDTRENYVESLILQMRYEFKRFNVSKFNQIETVFIGGGTPSTLSAKLYENIFREIKPFLKKGAEVTIEANPNSAKVGWLEEMKKLGVNRLSLGVQSFNEEKLKALGRNHNKKTAIDAIKFAKSLNFETLSIDLIYNYWTDNREVMKSDIDLALELGVSHISAYELTIESNTKFSETPKVAKRSEELARFVSSEIEKGGLKSYEVSNFGKISEHNFGYWQLKNYIGAGAGAVGFLDSYRIYSTSSIDGYIKNPISVKIEKLSKEDLITEKIFLGLRSSVGVNRNLISENNQDRVEILESEGLINIVDEIIYNKDFLLADEVALFLMKN
jgi:oxygen-independent coproporphyrinogen-3 oxidase